MILEFSKTHSDVKDPTRGNPSDAGMDVFYCPNPSEGIEGITIPPLGKALLPTGLKVSLPHGYALEIKNRGSMASKVGLIVGAHLVDAGYQGEIMIDLHNISQNPIDLKPGDKIAQFVVYPVVHVRMLEVDPRGLFEDQEEIVISNRKEGGFGSTGMK